MSKAKPKAVSCMFDLIVVEHGNNTLRRSNILEPPKTVISVDSKLVFLNGSYRMPWKKVNSLQIKEDEGFTLDTDQHTAVVSGPHPGYNWQLFRRQLKKNWQKQLNLRNRKSEEEKQQEEEERRNKRSYSSRSYSRSYTKKSAKWLSRNENQNNWDESDDEDTFNVTRPKRKPLEEEQQEQTAIEEVEPMKDDDAPAAADDDGIQGEDILEQSMENAVADVDLAERAKEEEEEDDASREEEFRDEDSEPEDAAPKPSKKKKKLKRKRVHQEDDSDDEMFGPEMTTPKPQSRTVSPHTIAKTRFVDDDDEDDDENDVPQEKTTTKTSKTVTPAIASFFSTKPAKKAKTETKIASQASAPPPVKRKVMNNNFFAPNSEFLPLNNDASEDDSQSTVVASPVSQNAGEATVEQSSVNPSTPKRKKVEFKKFGGSSTKKTIEEEDPLVESPQPKSPLRTPPKPFRRNLLGKKKTYGSSQKKDKASMALEMANASDSPIRLSLALALSPGRKRNKQNDSSPSRTPTRSPFAPSPSRLPMPDFRGIKNIGNTCYMNASLQMLYSVPSFLHQLSGGSDKLPEHSVVSSIVELFQELQQRNRAPASARNLKMAVDTKTNKFRGYQQRDANEFLGDLLDTMHDELMDVDKEEEMKEEVAEKKGVCVTESFFRLDVEVCLKCKSCGYTRTKEEMYRYLSLDILQKEGDDNTKPNVEQCLEAFFKPEDREIKCEKCEEGLVAEQTMKVLSRPKAILLHLKRFAMVEQPRKDDAASPTFVLRKNKAPLELTKALSLGPFSKELSSGEGEESVAATNQEYKIQSIVHHIGSSADSGHYTADALREDPKGDSGERKTWVSFDDNTVKRLSEVDVLDDKPRRKTAYMMLYTLAP